MSESIPVRETGRSTTPCSQFQTMANSKTTTESSFPPTPNAWSGEMEMAADLPRELHDSATFRAASGQWIERGGSAIIGPNAQYVLNPVFDREELLVSDLDLAQIDREMMTFDVSGHYARPDLFRFEKKL